MNKRFQALAIMALLSNALGYPEVGRFYLKEAKSSLGGSSPSAKG